VRHVFTGTLNQGVILALFFGIYGKPHRPEYNRIRWGKLRFRSHEDSRNQLKKSLADSEKVVAGPPPVHGISPDQIEKTLHAARGHKVVEGREVDIASRTPMRNMGWGYSVAIAMLNDGWHLYHTIVQKAVPILLLTPFWARQTIAFGDFLPKKWTPDSGDHSLTLPVMFLSPRRTGGTVAFGDFLPKKWAVHCVLLGTGNETENRDQNQN